MANTDYVATLNLQDPGKVVVPTVQANLDIVRGCHVGDSEPNAIVAGMLWLQGSTGVLWQRNSANSAWVAIQSMVPAVLVRTTLAAVSATGTTLLMTHKAPIVVAKLRLTSATTTAGSDGSNKWAWQLRNATDALNLFATAPDTNGNELTAHTPRELTPDQNLTVGADKVLRFDFTKTGSPTSPLAELLVEVTGYHRGA